MSSVTVTVDEVSITVASTENTVIQAIPAGLKGDKGDFSESTVVAQSALGSQRAITASGEYAGVKPAIGFSTQAVNQGADAPLLLAGELNGFSGLTAGEPVYLTTDGLISHTAPITGLYQKLGYAKTSSTIIIQIQQSVRL
jgi:hypothetical protein